MDTKRSSTRAQLSWNVVSPPQGGGRGRIREDLKDEPFVSFVCINALFATSLSTFSQGDENYLWKLQYVPY